MHGASLKAAIDALYEVFSSARLSSPFVGCLHCFTPSDLLYVGATPLRAFTHGDLYQISWKLVSTLGSPQDVCYFVPRFLDALAEGALLDVRMLSKKLAAIPPAELTPERCDQLREAFRCLFAASNPPDELADEQCRVEVREALPNVFDGSQEW